MTPRAYQRTDGRTRPDRITAGYAFPEKAERTVAAIRRRLTAGEYADLDGPALLARLKDANQGVRRVEHREGNVGLIDLGLIADAMGGARVIGAAMQLVAHSTALVRDLRTCLGGSPEGAAMWCSYFFGDDQVHLNDIYDRPTGATRQYWTTGHLPAPRYTDRPVYVLTGSTTFSAGEDVAYTLQAHGRAVVIGETTRGGAQPTARATRSPRRSR
ncbi:S41 family peptidase [Streptomyces sp. NPDC002044]|uniref:S41 family peptidase n=1 Tax=Streptomyces sp. NPDC002044 TaxID=3154662 RepID=UPI003329D5F9